MPRIVHLALLCLAAIVVSSSPSTARPEPRFDPSDLTDPLDRSAERIEHAHRHLRVLADPSMEGRFPGTVGIEVAKDYIERMFLGLGLEPAFDEVFITSNGIEVVTPRAQSRQPFDLDRTAATPRGQASVTRSGEVFELTEDDVSFPPFSDEGAFEGPIVFAGYGIVIGGDGYMSYPPVTNLEGKAVMILRYEPTDENGVSRWAEGRGGWSDAASASRKAIAAARRGAGAVIFVDPPGMRPIPGEDAGDAINTPIKRDTGVPVLHISPEVADALISAGSGGEHTLESLAANAQTEGGLTELPEAGVHLEVTKGTGNSRAENIAFVLPGRGKLADEYVVIGAHHDHVGRGLIGSRAPELFGMIHPGADDNASGVAATLLVADMLTSRDAEIADNARSVIFMTFSGEESGLEGSRHFVRNPPVPTRDMVLMINLDMVGRLRDELEIGGIDSIETLPALITPAIARSNIPIAQSVSVGEDRSDHANFARAGVPYLFFFTGLHDQYHTPADRIEGLNIEGVVSIAELIGTIAHDARTSDALGETRHQRPGRTAMGERPMIRVRMGLVPTADIAGQTGVRVQTVFDDTAASEAGILPGDRIIGWNDTPIEDVIDWTRALTGPKPGDVVELKIIRNGSERTIRVKLRAE